MCEVRGVMVAMSEKVRAMVGGVEGSLSAQVDGQKRYLNGHAIV